MGLWAGALVTFHKIVCGVDPGVISAYPTLWGSLMVFLHSAIMFSLTGPVIFLVAIKMCSDLPLTVQQRLLEERFPNFWRTTTGF